MFSQSKRILVVKTRPHGQMRPRDQTRIIKILYLFEELTSSKPQQTFSSVDKDKGDKGLTVFYSMGLKRVP